MVLLVMTQQTWQERKKYQVSHFWRQNESVQKRDFHVVSPPLQPTRTRGAGKTFSQPNINFTEEQVDVNLVLSVELMKAQDWKKFVVSHRETGMNKDRKDGRLLI